MDLTHKLTPSFSYGQVPPRMELVPEAGSGVDAGMRMNRLSLVEHTGTHFDAPSHFGEDQADLGSIPIDDLVLPLVVVDVRNKVREELDYAVQLTDLLAWEDRHGAIPAGSCVALHSGCDPVSAANVQAPASMPMPGFAPECAQWLALARKVKGVAVDSMTLDARGNIPAYPFHRAWLGLGGWGIEGIANLSAVPPRDALLFVGVPPVQGATGMPIRAVAIF